MTQMPLDSILTAAEAAAGAVATASPAERAGWLRAIADDLENHADELLGLAQQETHLAEQRLRGEMGRTCFQLRLTADAAEEGSWLEATIDHDDPAWPTGPRPDLRRYLHGVGPVLVVAASNFPFAFSVAGGDTATALAAGCPVVLKAHPGHLRLSVRTAEIVTAALDRTGAPAGSFALFEGEQETRDALSDPRIRAGAFTGSVRGGRALFDIATSRPDPIPFYGELGSVNPAFVLPAALKERRDDVLNGFVGSFTLGTGQFCTKPGLLLVPSNAGVVEALAEKVTAVAAAPMLNDRIADGFTTGLGRLTEQWTTVVSGLQTPQGFSPSLFATSVSAALKNPDALFEECFGPTAVVVEYADNHELLAFAAAVPGQLTVTVQAGTSDEAAQLLAILGDKAGRVVWNGWPTGVSVSWAMQHGGSWPSTTASLHTSVGPTAIRRFVRPLSLQNVPAELLPAPVQDANPWHIWQRIDGILTAPTGGSDKG